MLRLRYINKKYNYAEYYYTTLWNANASINSFGYFSGYKESKEKNNTIIEISKTYR